MIYHSIQKRIKFPVLTLITESPIKNEELNWSYIMASLCHKLALRMNIKQRLSVDRLEELGINFWQ